VVDVAAPPAARPAPDVLRRRELAAFLRSRRERIAPQRVGLPGGGRRRTPGLRREEVANLAGVGVTWYTWLEQGRDIRVSEQVLDAIARTLQLDGDERAHLFALAGAGEREVAPDREPVPRALQLVLDQLDPMPAVVLNRRTDILAFNAGYDSLLGVGPSLADIPVEERNCLWLSFTLPEWRAAMVEWEDTVARMVAQLRASMAEHVGEPAWKSFVHRLSDASPEFTAMWERHEVRGVENRTKAIVNARVGLIRVDFTNLWFGPSLQTRLVTYTPTDDESRDRLHRLADLRGKSR
jgi:transcriptional regulator with XRE-family HTH domain